LLAIVLPPQVTLVTTCSFSEAWMIRTAALPGCVVSWSSMTWSRRPDSGPMPATV